MMFRKLVAINVIILLCVAFSGCRKKTEPSPQTATATSTSTSTVTKIQVKTQAEYDAQAKKDINTANMKNQLDKIESDIEKESGARH